MQYIAVVDGFAHGPFATKEAADMWAKHTLDDAYGEVICSTYLAVPLHSLDGLAPMAYGTPDGKTDEILLQPLARGEPIDGGFFKRDELLRYLRRNTR